MDDNNAETLRRLAHIEETLLEIEDRLYELNRTSVQIVEALARFRATQLAIRGMLGVTKDTYEGEPPA